MTPFNNVNGKSKSLLIAVDEFSKLSNQLTYLIAYVSIQHQQCYLLKNEGVTTSFTYIDVNHNGKVP
jgi:hypothetical protein